MTSDEALRAGKGWTVFTKVDRKRPGFTLECDGCGVKPTAGKHKDNAAPVYYESRLQSPKGMYGGVTLLCAPCVEKHFPHRIVR